MPMQRRKPMQQLLKLKRQKKAIKKTKQPLKSFDPDFTKNSPRTSAGLFFYARGLY
jgi:hypothetical protein